MARSRAPIERWRGPEPWYRQFQRLMPYRVREILLVSSGYDAFVLEEDGSISERLFAGFSELRLSQAPRITHADSARRAYELLAARRFDLVITVVRLRDVDAAALSQKIKQHYRHLPVVLLIFDEADLLTFPRSEVPATIDHVFLWTGDADLLLAAIKLIEDERNVPHDTSITGVQVVLVVEDRIRAYSSFLGLLYLELLTQSGSLFDEGLNEMHRLIRMRGRPRIVLATSFEHAHALYQRLRRNIRLLISDIRIPRGGAENAEAGLELVRAIRADNRDIPILFQSAEKDVMDQVAELQAGFVDKNAPTFAAQVRRFLRDALGLGAFVFRMPDHTEIARARDTFEMEQLLATVPIESVVYHSSHNHFSVWLAARTLFDLAELLRPRSVGEFGDPEQMRSHLVGVLRRAREREQEGVITDFSPRHRVPRHRFVRIGQGSIGGKGRSVAFVSTLITRYGLLNRFPNLEIRIPKSVAIGVEFFDQFMEQLFITELLSMTDDRDISRHMIERRLPADLVRDLQTAFEALEGPLAVRSSSLLEDSRFQPFAGVYATYMLPNNHPDPKARFAELCRAIKGVYASAFWTDTRTFLEGTPHDIEQQKMGVLVQQVVGQPFGSRYYPHAAGVAQSHNFYPLGRQQASDGVAHIALGLGHTVVTGGLALRFSPGEPSSLPQFGSAESVLSRSQGEFFAVDLRNPTPDFVASPEASLARFTLAEAEADGTLALCGSVYSPEDDVIRDNLRLHGPRLVTFNNVLRHNEVPLADALAGLLEVLRRDVGEEVEVEFALDMCDWGRSLPKGQQPRTPRLYVLQVRPMRTPEYQRYRVDLESIPAEAFLCRTGQALGNGTYDQLRDIIFVDRDDIHQRTSPVIAQQVRALNQQLKEAGRSYLLIGPGRWGSSDPTLGIPVRWSHISEARAIIETPIGERRVEPSQGSHFFHNVTAKRIGYLTVGADRTSMIDRVWLDAAPVQSAVENVRHVRLDEPLGVHLDGRRGYGAVLKQASWINGDLDDEES